MKLALNGVTMQLTNLWELKTIVSVMTHHVINGAKVFSLSVGVSLLCWLGVSIVGNEFSPTLLPI